MKQGSQCSVPFDCPLKRKIQVVVKGQSSAESIRILWPQYLMKFRLRLFAVRYSLISVELDYINMPNRVFSPALNISRRFLSEGLKFVKNY